MTHDDLIARLTAATDGTREMSDDFARVMGWKRESVNDIITGWEPVWKSPSGRTRATTPDFTRSVDAALSAIPTGWFTNNAYENPLWNWVLCSGRLYSEGVAATPALALCVAVLRAMASDSEGEG